MSRRIIIISIIFVCIIVLTYLSIPAIAVLGESLLVRFEIRNPYVNSGFCGWSCANVEDFGSFLIPNEWSLEEESGIYKIIDDSNKVWAVGAVVGTEASHFDDYEDLVSAIYKLPSVKITTDPYTEFLMMNGSDVDLLHVQGDVFEDDVFCIQLFENSQKELVWIMRADITLDEEQYNIAEAIVYSFAFGI